MTSERPTAQELIDRAPMSVQFVKVDDTMWPIFESAEWVLRYGTVEAREAQRYGVASILSAYSSLFNPCRSQADAITMFKRARRAVAQALLEGQKK